MEELTNTSYAAPAPLLDLSRSLEAELRAAQERRSSVTEEDLDGDGELDFESGIYVGVGTRSKTTGYLAHGGAGGIPVFMGEGYVDGAGVGGGTGDRGAGKPTAPASSSRQRGSSLPVRVGRRI
ncbi:hypothetical protein ONZ45_g14270 [Pleurotus djamor]|nr:hypothetical protein ONZ45_g14270 [Pleurotus djamor]